MRVFRTVTSLTLGAAFVLGAVAAQATQQTVSNAQVTSGLKIIKLDADRIASGRYQGKSLQAPAHQIGAEWYQIEPVLAKNGAVLVETQMANRAITNFDTSWKRAGKARVAAKQVSETVADLMSAYQSNPTATPPSMSRKRAL